jgi:hypothetical protein
MSTGDQSQYVRAKLAERGSNSQAKFMMDGFDRWAESTAPAREGQMEKMPAESQMASYGGAMTLSKAKQRLHRLEGIHELEGGVDIIPQAVKDAANEAKKIFQIWRGISSRIDSFMEELQDQIIDDPNRSPSLVNFAKKLKEKFNEIKFLKDILDGAAKLAESFGAGKKRKYSVKLYGGASLSWSDLAGYATRIAELYSWLKENAKNIRSILAMKSLQPEGGQILNVVDPIFKAIGMGRPSGGRSASACCECDDMKGGFMPVDEIVRLNTRPTYRQKVDYYEPGIKTGGFNPVGDMMRLAGNPGYGQKTTHPGIAYGEKMAIHSGIQKAEGGRSRSARKVAIMDGPSYDEPSYGGASCGGRKPSARGAIVKKVMREQGLSLPQASKYVKENGLY